MNRITVLGSGTSTGVPILGCACAVCQSNDLRNKRFRTSAIIELGNKKKILIDASPDLRTQLLTAGISSLDGVIITHDHADHTHGIDDLRPFGFQTKRALPVYCGKETAQSLTNKFPYIFQRDDVFKDRPILGGGIPLLDLEEVVPGESKIFGEEFEIFSLSHGYTSTLALKHSKMAYITDCREIPEEVLKTLRDSKLELLFLDCLRYEPHSTHLHFDLSLEYIQAIKPAKTILIHMGHEIDYLQILGDLRMRSMKNILPAVDGMSFLYS